MFIFVVRSVDFRIDEKSAVEVQKSTVEVQKSTVEVRQLDQLELSFAVSLAPVFALFRVDGASVGMSWSSLY